MTDPEPTLEKGHTVGQPPISQKEPTPEELQQIDAGMRRNLYLLGRMLFEKYQITHEVPKDRSIRGFLVNTSTSYITARSVERQEVLMNQMHEESERMTSLTRWVTCLTAAVLVVAVLQVILLIIQICTK